MPENFVKKSGKCLSDEGGRYALPPQARKLLCLTEDHMLYVAKGHEKEPWPLAYQELLRREGFDFRMVSKPLAEIETYYSKGKEKQETPLHTSVRQGEVVQLVREAVQARATDIHLILSDSSTQIKFRVDGDLKTVSEVSHQDGHDLCATIYQTMCDVAEPVFNPRRSQDARLMTEAMTDVNLYGGRVATRPTDRGLLLVIRLLYERLDAVNDLEGLGYLKEQVHVITRMSERKFGINILSGPTGSGKSTTLECVMRKIIKARRERIHVLTIEDPPEYRIAGAVQTPLLCDKADEEAISLEWAHSITNAMRLDPDVLMCGEIRDLSSAKTTFRAAMTGHGVWTTLHANDALAILTRLQDLGISMGLLTDPALVTGLVSQVLVRRLCEQCRISYRQGADQIEAEQRERIEKACNVERAHLRGKGCAHCLGEGIRGRTVVAETIEPTPELMSIYEEKGKNAARIFWLKEMKGLSKLAVLAKKVEEGSIDPRDGEEDVGLFGTLTG